jgi:hypothetical protein
MPSVPRSPRNRCDARGSREITTFRAVRTGLENARPGVARRGPLFPAIARLDNCNVKTVSAFGIGLSGGDERALRYDAFSHPCYRPERREFAWPAPGRRAGCGEAAGIDSCEISSTA